MFGPSASIVRRTSSATLRRASRMSHNNFGLRSLVTVQRAYPLPASAKPSEAARHPRSRCNRPGIGPVRYQSQSSATGGVETKKYTFDDLQVHLAPATQAGGPDPRPAPLLLIDVREPAELQTTGWIPTAQNLPISSVPDGAFLPPEEFEDRFGFSKPVAGDEVVFYCKSGVRSRAAAQMVADSWGREGVKVSEFPGSWTEWASRGGEVER